MNSIERKIEGAQAMITSLLHKYARPVVMSSFGKDSIVMLHLLKSAGVRLPVIFHKETPLVPSKFAFAHRMIEAEGYAVYEYPPLTTRVVRLPGGQLDVISIYQIGPRAVLWMPAGIEPAEKDRAFLCGLHDFYHRPTGTFQYPWDVTLVGHKSSDTNPWLGAVPLRANVEEMEGGSDLAFPLRNFTDADVWEYLRRFAVPYNEERYVKRNVDFDNDHYPACTRCMDDKAPARVTCPKLKREIDNMAGRVIYATLEKPAYMA